MHVREAERRLGSAIPWLCDNMANDLKRALGGAQNAELVFDREGLVVRRRAWSDPEELRKDLAELLGEVDPPTRVADLDLKTAPPSRTVAIGVLPRLEVPGPMRAVKIEPFFDNKMQTPQSRIPYYAKLRAEVDQEFLDTGKGSLYLGFHLDPLYQVHWNNLTPPLEFHIDAPETIRVHPSSGIGPALKVAADADPREFLVELTATGRDEPIDLTVRYFACDDAGTFCVPVTQKYRIRLEPDPFAGRVSGRGGMPGGRPFRGGNLADRIMGWDADGDGRVVREEFPDRMIDRFDRIDRNGDGAVTKKEAKRAAKRMRKDRGGRRGSRRF